MYQNILVPIDLSHKNPGRRTLPTAIDLIGRTGGRLTLMTVVDLDPNSGWLQSGDGRKLFDDYMAKAERRLATLIAEQIPDGIDTAQFVTKGSVYRQIVRVAKEVGASLVVMAPHRPSVKDYMLGSNAARVARLAECSVLIVREQAG